MSIEDYKWQRKVMEMQSQGKLSPFRELLEQWIDLVVYRDRKSNLGASYGQRSCEIGDYRNDYKPDNTTDASGSLNLMASKISDSVDTPLYTNTMNQVCHPLRSR